MLRCLARDCRFGPGDDGADCLPACKHSALRPTRIVVLDDGKAVGIGTHEQLLESCEEYQEIYWSQNERVLAKEEA